MSIRAISGPDNYMATYVNLRIASVNNKPERPVVTSVQMSNTGRKMFVNFDKDTDKGSSIVSNFAFTFDCSNW